MYDVILDGCNFKVHLLTTLKFLIDVIFFISPMFIIIRAIFKFLANFLSNME